MARFFDGMRIRSGARALFNEAVGPPAAALTERQRLAKLLKISLDIALDKGMFGIWRTVTEVGQARENAALRARFARSGGKAPLRSIDDLDDRHMRPLLFHLERSVIPRLFGSPRGKPRSFTVINDRIDQAVAHDLRTTPDSGQRPAIQAILARVFDNNDQTDPGFSGHAFPKSSEGLTGFQSLKGFVQICQIMLTQAPSFRLSLKQRDTLRETLRAWENYAPLGQEIALPAAAQKDADDFRMAMAEGDVAFSRDGGARMRTTLEDYPQPEDERTFIYAFPEASPRDYDC
jgi:hypothetical protein